MAKVGGELGQKPLDVGALAIPGEEAVNCKTVSKVMQARLMSRPGAGAHDIGFDA